MNTLPLCLLEESATLELRRQARSTDPYRLGEMSDALEELETLFANAPEAFKQGISRRSIEDVVDTLLTESQRIKAEVG